MAQWRQCYCLLDSDSQGLGFFGFLFASMTVRLLSSGGQFSSNGGSPREERRVRHPQKSLQFGKGP